MSIKNVVLIAVVHGVSGRAAAEHWISIPGTRLYGLSRRSAPLPLGVEAVSADLFDRDDVERKLGQISGGTARFSWALIRFSGDALQSNWSQSRRLLYTDQNREAKMEIPVEETRQYIRDFDRLAGMTETARELYDKMLELHPEPVNPLTLLAFGAHG